MPEDMLKVRGNSEYVELFSFHYQIQNTFDDFHSSLELENKYFLKFPGTVYIPLPTTPSRSKIHPGVRDLFVWVFFVFWSHSEIWDLRSQPGIKPMPRAVEAQS